jgi:uncharacterized protein (TIGR00297 family)
MLTTVMSWYLEKHKIIPPALSRKLLHITAIGISAFAVLYIDAETLLWITGTASLILTGLVLAGFLHQEEIDRNSWGIPYFALSLFLLLLVFQEKPALVFYPMLILALADGLAAVAGFYIGRHTFSFTKKDVKSIEGSITFFLVSIACFELIPGAFDFISRPFHSLWLSIIVSAFLAAVEALSIKGRDNLWLPFAVMYWLLLDVSFFEWTHSLWFALIIIGCASVYKLKWLTGSGSLAAFSLGCVLLFSPHPEWTLLAASFFIVGSLLSKLPGRSRTEKSGRNADQVFCNGGAATGFLALYFICSETALLIGASCGFAAALSDTVSSEIGSRYQRINLDLRTFTTAKSGLSGAISPIGTLAGVAASILMAFIAVAVSGQFSWKWIVIIALVGFVGNVMDSLLGAFLQIRYAAAESENWQDKRPTSGSYISKGMSWISNDRVNFLATTGATCLGALIYTFFY